MNEMSRQKYKSCGLMPVKCSDIWLELILSSINMLHELNLSFQLKNASYMQVKYSFQVKICLQIVSVNDISLL